MNKIRMVLGGVIALGAVGYGYYARSHAGENTKAEMLSACSGDAACLSAVNTHIDACIREVTAAHPNDPAEGIRAHLVVCVNQKSGAAVFTIGH